MNFVSWHGTEPELFVTDSELAKEILNNREKVFLKMDPGVFLRKIIGDGLFATDGEKWAKLRTLANHAFRTESLKVISIIIALTY